MATLFGIARHTQEGLNFKRRAPKRAGSRQWSSVTREGSFD
jgi:hypothetical protein